MNPVAAHAITGYFGDAGYADRLQHARASIMAGSERARAASIWRVSEADLWYPVVCSWCGAVTGFCEAEHSSGICNKCLAKHFPEEP